MVRIMKPAIGVGKLDQNSSEDKACHSVSIVNVQLMLGQIYLNNGKFSDAFSMF